IIQDCQFCSLRTRFILSSADDSRRFEVELGEVGTSVHVFRIQLHGTLKLGSYFLGQSRGGKKTGGICLFSIGPTKPQVVVAVVWSKFDGLLAGGCSAIPVFHGEIGTA